MAGWLYVVDQKGLLVEPKFYERLRKGQSGAMRALAKADLTARYRDGFNVLSRWQMLDLVQPRLFPEMDPVPEHERMPDHVRIPFVRGRACPPAWVPDYVTYNSPRMDKKSARIFKRLKANIGAALHIEYKSGRGKATVLKPNPKFELVVVNKYDRAALLHLLDALDPATNVDAWLAERTNRSGATSPSTLHADYSAWCERRGEAATGTKSFVQTLVAAGVVKLKRGKDGERYELELRRA